MSFSAMRGIGFNNETQQRPVGDYYLFVIAIDKYEEAKIPKYIDGNIVMQPTFPNLSNPVLDASRIVKVLLNKYQFSADKNNSRILQSYSPDVIEYNTIRTKCLYNEKATASNITIHLNEINNSLKENDNLLIYFAGHGDDDPIHPSGCLIPFDGINNSSESNTWFKFESLSSLFKYPKCQNLLIILDSCFAGKAILGAKTTSSTEFSRRVLVSSSPQQTAADGIINQGSPFAKALCETLEANTFGYAELDITAFKQKFTDFYILMFDENPTQEVIYENLPMDCGLGNFIFELKEKNTPPAATLTQTFVQHLNFSKEKKLLEDRFDKFSSSDLNLIITRESDEPIHELLRAVLFSKLCKIDENFGCNMNLREYTPHPLSLDINGDLNVWTVLVSTFDAHLKANPLDYAINTIVGQLLSKHMIISLYSANLTKDFTANILNFLKEFTVKFKAAKQQRSDAGLKDEKYKKLFFVIWDSREKGEDFFKDNEMETLLGTDYNLFVNTPTEALMPSRASDWFGAIRAIGFQNIQDLRTTDFFQNLSHQYSILKFIYLVCDKVKVDKIEVNNTIKEYYI